MSDILVLVSLSKTVDSQPIARHAGHAIGFKRLSLHHPHLFPHSSACSCKEFHDAAIRSGGRDSESYRGIVLALRGEAPYLTAQPGRGTKVK